MTSRTILLSIFAIVLVIFLLAVLNELKRHITRRKFLKYYQAFFDEIVEMELENGKQLSEEKRIAVGQKVVRDIIEKACERVGIPEDERTAKKLELEQYVKEKLPDVLDNTPYIYTGSGFVEKKSN